MGGASLTAEDKDVGDTPAVAAQQVSAGHRAEAVKDGGLEEGGHNRVMDVG